jgi:hypothetical protein
LTELLGKKLAQATVDDYADVVSLTIQPDFTKLSVYIKEKNVNAVKYKILGSMDGSVYGYEITSETVIAKNGSVYETPTTNAKLADPMLYVKVQVKASVGTNQGSVDCYIAGSS